jgi:ribosomal protein S25
MKKTIEIQIPDLFQIQDPIKDQVLKLIKKQKRTTQSIVSQKLNCSMFAARSNLMALAREKIIKDIGIHVVKGRHVRIYEY